ncbi:MAG: GNAT family N-acetyltransferase, partial [bacterium]
ERQAFLNAAFDGFHDLAEIMGVPPKAMSLGGQLGVAFGAQGKGGNAAAHFVPGLNEINLTKTMGAGALAHEVGPALDHWFAVQAGLGSNAEPWLSSHPSRPAMVPRMVQEGGKWTRREEPGYADTIRPEVVEAFRQVVKAMDKRDAAPEDLAAQREATLARAKKNLDGWLKRARSAMQPERADPQLLAEFDRLAEAIKAFDLGDGYVKAGQKMFAPRVAELRDVVRRASGRLLSLEDTEGIENTARHAIYMMQSENFERTHSPQRSTKYAADSHAMDKHKGGKAYWGTAWEKFARAFETWVHDRLVERGALNTFLSNADERSQSPVTIPDESSAMARGSGATRDLYLWPTGEERQAMSKAFSALVDGLKVREDDDGNVTLYSRGQAGMGSRPAAVQAAVDRLTANWTNAPEVEVLGSMADAPKAVRDHDAKMRSQGATGEPEGFFYKGKVYLNASMLGDQAAVERVLFHETLGHFGLRGAFGPELDSVLRQVVAGRRSEVEAKRKAYGLPDTDAGRLVAAEEVLAELAQTKPELGLVKRALAAIRAVLRKLGLGGRMSDAELVREFIEPARAFVERGGKPQDFTDTEPMVRQLFSRVTRSKAFKRWFGDSKVVDAEGKPLVVYHGTGADFAEFDPSSYARNFTGDYGVGFYFTQDAKKAGQYADGAAGKGGAPNVMPVYLALKNPAIVSAAFGDGDLWRMVPGAKSREELTAGLIAQGYDGVIVDGGRAGVLYVKEAVAFRPEQIKSATGNSGAFDAANPDIRFSRDGRLERREVQRDFDGSPWLEGDGLDLVAPKEVLRPEVIADEGESLLRFQIMASGSAKSVGFVELLMRDGRPVALLDIEVKPEGRKNGTGRRAVEAALAAADGDLEISNIVTAARGFWEKLGVPEQNLPDGYAYQGVLNAETYRQGPGADAQGVRGAAGQAAREGAPGVGQPRGAGAPESLGGEEPGADEGLDETLFSRAPSRQAFADFMEAAKDRTSTSRFNGLHKSLATQLHKAWVDKDFAKVFQRAQDFERDVARAATRPAEAAPDLLPTFDNLRSAWHRLVHGDKDAERVRQVGAAVWAGTLEGGPEPHTGKVWSKAE